MCTVICNTVYCAEIDKICVVAFSLPLRENVEMQGVRRLDQLPPSLRSSGLPLLQDFLQVNFNYQLSGFHINVFVEVK